MTSQNSEATSSEDEDKKYVSQAVAFVIGHARNGFVPLCASVASLLKEQTRLKLQLESLEQECLLLKNTSKTGNSPTKYFEIREKCKVLKSQPIGGNERSVENFSKSASIVKCLNKVPYRNLKGCVCNQCSPNKSYVSFAVPLEKGEKVVIRGEICGVVQYVGHVDSLNFPEIYVGLRLSQCIGNSNGTIQDKTYFSVPRNQGLFVPLSYVCCLISKSVKK